MAKKICLLAAGLMLLAGTGGMAQEVIQPAPQAEKGVIPLKLQVVLSRYDGEKKVSSLPYTLSVNVGVPGGRDNVVSLRMGVQVPVPSTTFPGSGKDGALQSFTYQNVGTKIDCSAHQSGDGRFRLAISLEQSSIYGESQQLRQTAGLSPAYPQHPMFRTFNASFSVLLRDGQTAQYTTATDPVSGEVLKVDVTLNVIK